MGCNLVPEAWWLSFRYGWYLEGGVGSRKLPVERAIHLPAVVGSKAIRWRLRARGCYFSLRIKIHGNETPLIDPATDLKQTVGGLVESLDLVELRCLD